MTSISADMAGFSPHSLPAGASLSASSHPVKWGIDYVRDENGKPVYMTRGQALRYGRKNMDQALRQAGFDVTVSLTNKAMHGGVWFRLTVEKTIPATRGSVSA